IHDGECVSRIPEYLDGSAVTPIIHFNRAVASGLDSYSFRPGQDKNLAAIDLNQCSVLQIILCQSAVRYRRIDTENHAELRRAGSVLLNREIVGRTQGHG